jgi:SAM-dependent methyltransferase
MPGRSLEMNNKNIAACGAENTELSDLKASEEFYNGRYRQRYMESWPLEKCSRVSRLLQELPLPRNGCVLDYGCGAGVFTAILKSILPKWEVHGTDISSAALEIAGERFPDCNFHQLSDCEKLHDQFDFIFTHHVLEHVSSLPETAALFGRLLKPDGVMFHILPCADKGSLEYTICTLRRDGIVGDIETRFFLDEEGHLRRLTTQDLSDLWPDPEFHIERAFYANHYYGGLKFLTDHDHELNAVLEIANPEFAVNSLAAIRLNWFRFIIVALWIIRKPVFIIKNKMTYGLNSLRDWIMFVFALIGYPFSKPVDLILNKLANWEWTHCSNKIGGSEMYLFIVRRTDNPINGI